ncbi:MAG: hypothetical protein AB8G14_14000 [Ilumatobacter sp.]
MAAAITVATVVSGAGLTMAGTAAADQSVAGVSVPVDVLQLGCEGRVRDDVAAIGCRWTVPDGAVGVRLVRLAVGSGEARQVIHRTSDPWSNTFVDTEIRRGVRYLYVVQAIDAAGGIVATSRPAVAGVAPNPSPDVEVLRLDCSATGEVAVRCRWTVPIEPARTLTLWRSVDGAAREVVESFAAPFPTSYGDLVPTSTTRAIYAVIATDSSGEIVARSRADGVAFTVTPTTIPPTTIPPITIPPITVAPITVAPSTVAPSEADAVEVRPAPESIDSTLDRASVERVAGAQATTMPTATTITTTRNTTVPVVVRPRRPVGDVDDSLAPERERAG